MIVRRSKALPRAVRECIMMRKFPRRSLLTFIIALMAVAYTATPVWAWGRLGHRAISRFAEQHVGRNGRGFGDRDRVDGPDGLPRPDGRQPQ
jgi:hypothetical protein